MTFFYWFLSTLYSCSSCTPWYLRSETEKTSTGKGERRRSKVAKLRGRVWCSAYTVETAYKVAGYKVNLDLR